MIRKNSNDNIGNDSGNVIMMITITERVIIVTYDKQTTPYIMTTTTIKMITKRDNNQYNNHIDDNINNYITTMTMIKIQKVIQYNNSYI